MRIPYCHTITDEKLGVTVAYDIECELECSADLEQGVPVVSVDGVYVDGKNLFRGTPLTQSIAAEIANAAEDEDWVREKVIDAEGITFRGRGPHDPRGHFVGAH